MLFRAIFDLECEARVGAEREAEVLARSAMGDKDIVERGIGIGIEAVLEGED